MNTLASLEETALSIWLRESGAAFFTTLTFHSLAMGLVVGINIAVALRLIGIAPKLSLSGLARFYPIHWIAVLVIFISGTALLIAYPAKAITNPVFYLKLLTLTAGLVLARKFQLHAESLSENEQRLSLFASQPVFLGALSLLLWATTISAGRFLAYTHSVLLASRYY